MTTDAQQLPVFSPERGLTFEVLQDMTPVEAVVTPAGKLTDRAIPSLFPEVFDVKEREKLAFDIWQETIGIEELYGQRLEISRQAYLASNNSVSPMRKVLRQLWRSWVLKATQTPPVTMRDVHNEAAEIGGRLFEEQTNSTIGGRLFAEQENAKQSFFWLPETVGLTPKAGEIVYIKQEALPSAPEKLAVTSHIHYAVSSSAAGEVTITKSLAGKVGDEVPTYQPIDTEELRDLSTSVAFFRTALAINWS